MTYFESTIEASINAAQNGGDVSMKDIANVAFAMASLATALEHETHTAKSIKDSRAALRGFNQEVRRLMTAIEMQKDPRREE